MNTLSNQNNAPKRNLILNDVTEDNVINAKEARQGHIVLSGQVLGEVAKNDKVRFFLDDNTYYTRHVDENGKFSLNLAIRHLVDDDDNVFKAELISSLGNLNAVKDYSVDTKVPKLEITLDNVTADNVIDEHEAPGRILLTGRATGEVKAGDKIRIYLDEETFYTRTVDENGYFSLDISANRLIDDLDKTLHATMTVTDDAGNMTTAVTSKMYKLDSSLPDEHLTKVILNNVTEDNVINAQEAQGKIILTGKVTGEFNTGDKVRIYLDEDKYYTRHIDKDGNFSLSLDASHLRNDADKKIKAVVFSDNVDNDVIKAMTEKVYSVDTVAPNAHSTKITLDNVTEDNIINAEEAREGQIVLKGKVTGDFSEGDKVRIYLDDNIYYTRHVDANGNFELGLNARHLINDADKTFKAVLEATDKAGNKGIIEASKTYDVDTKAPQVEIRLDNVTKDNVINAQEAKGKIVLTGQVSGEFNAGDQVRINLDEKTFYTRRVDENGRFSLEIRADRLVNDADKTIHATISKTDAAGNNTIATVSKKYGVATHKPEVSISLDNVTEDNVINAQEAKGKITLTGKVTGEFSEGDQVRIYLDDNSFYTRSVDKNGHFSLELNGKTLANDADRTIKAVAFVKDSAGNHEEASVVKHYEVDTTAPNAKTTTVTLNDVTADNIINAQEAQGRIILNGRVTGEFNAGDKVRFYLDDDTVYTRTVDENGYFALNIEGADLVNDADKTFKVVLLAKDSAGNQGAIEATKTYGVDTTVPVATITVDNITDDNMLNSKELAGKVNLTGTVSGEFNQGDVVTINVNGKNYTTTLNAQGKFSAEVDGREFANDADKKVLVTVVVTDTAGNSATVNTQKAYSLAPTGYIEIDTVVPNFEHKNVLNLTGHTSEVKSGELVDIVITDANGKEAKATAQVQQDGSFFTEADVSGLTFGQSNKSSVLTIKATTVDKGGVTISDTEHHGLAMLNYMTHSIISDSETATYASYATHSTAATTTFSSEEGYQTGKGDDVIAVNYYVTGRSTIETYAGNDTVLVGTNIDHSTVNLGEGDNLLVVGAANWVDGYITGGSVITAGSGNDHVYVRTNVNASTLDLGDGNNEISIGGFVAGKTTVISTGKGDDVITVNSNIDDSTINLGAGNDVLKVGGYITSAAKINGGEGQDTLVLLGAKNTISLKSIVEVETININGSGANTLRVTSKDVHNAGTTVFIKGGEDDTVDFGNAGKSMREGRGSWSKVDSQQKDGIYYDGYAHSDNQSEILYVQQGVQII